MYKKYRIWGLWIFGLTCLCVIVAFISLGSGSADIAKNEIFDILFKKIQGHAASTPQAMIILNLRMPRIILGFMVGGALALAGVIFQGLFRNPLVEPYTLGTSGGAALAVSLVVVSGYGMRFGLPLAGFLGALLSIFLVYIIGNKWKGMKITSLLLTGVMFSFICSSLIMLVMSLAKSEQAHGIIFWIMGSLEGKEPFLLKLICFVVPVGAILSFTRAWDLNALSLGEEDALHMGIDIENTKRRLFIISSLMTGAAVSVSGIIGFVGLVVPHFVRMAVGGDHRILMPASFLLGGAFLVLCDTIARTIIAPIELPVGVITGIVGGIGFLYFLSKEGKRI